ncbi:phosphatase PAP2 family protein [Geodermatophilus sp. SYSU D00691]
MDATLTTGARRAPRTGAGDRAAGRPVRHPTDLVRVLLGLAVTGIGFLIAQQGELSAFERDLFRLVNDLPGILFPVVWAVMQLGNVVAVPVVAGLAAVTRRWRMARDLLISGLLAYVTADFVKSVVGRERPGGLPVGAVLHEGPITGLGFISGHSAVAAALAAAAAPYLSRRGRRIVWTLAWLVALGRVYVGAHLPLDIVGGLATGWAIGALVHWVFGVPRWHPDAARAGQLLRRLGLPLHDLGPAGVRARSSHPFEGVDAGGRRLYVKLLDPDPFERDWLHRLYRLLVFRDVKDADAVAPLDQQAQQEAFAALTARECGARVPRVVHARGDHRGAVVVQEYVTGRPLDELPPGDVTADLLHEVWQQVALLREAGIAHHDLVASSVLVDEQGRPWIVDFGNARTSADEQEQAGDHAELMASLALRLPPATVVDSAVDVLGPRAVGHALPGLAPLSLTAATRAGLAGHDDRLGELRQEVRARVGMPDPDRPAFPPPGLPARLAAAAGTLAVLVGVPVLGDATAVVESVEVGGWRWLGAGLALAVLARAATAAGALAVVDRRLALGRTYGASMVADGATLLHGRVGWRRAAARYLERAGVQPVTARRGVDRFTAGAVVAAVVVAVAALVLAFVEGGLIAWRAPAAMVPAVVLGAAATALVLLGQWLAGRHDPTLRDDRAEARRGLVTSLREGMRRGDDVEASWRRGPLLGWAALAVVLEAATLAAVVHAVGGDLLLLETVSVYAVLHLLWSVVPVSGTPGAADLVLLLVLTALGAPLASACAAVLVFRLLTFWLPAAGGALLAGRFERRLLL